MMINTSKLSKGLIIFLVYYLTIISTVTSSPTDTDEKNVITEKFITITGPSLEELLARDNDTEFKQKLVDDNSEILTKQQISQIMGSIQLGIKHEMKQRTSTPELDDDVLPDDFKDISTRRLFGIAPKDYVNSFCESPLHELSNPGASKSIFYRTPDDKFIMKTVQQTEDECLLKLLPRYTTYLDENRESLLPKFSGFYGYQCKSIDNKLVSMNNLLPSNVPMHQKFDLKGSTLGRKASSREKSKKSPTFKDLDFNYELHPKGIFLKPDTRLALLKTIKKDCKILKDFNIMDYSILMGVFNIDHPSEVDVNLRLAAVTRWNKLMADSVGKKSIQADWTVSDEYYASLSGSIPAKSVNGDRLLLFVGIIDILQTFRTTKIFEHSLKSFKLKVTPGVIETAESISVQHPKVYASRFLEYMTDSVFKPMLSPEELVKLSKQPVDIPLSRKRGCAQITLLNIIDCFK